MNNFGVIELASTKTSHAPGWAYVPDVGHTPSTTIVPGNRKRAARNQAAASGTDLSARFDAKIRKEIESLDRDNARDVSIVVPGKANRATTATKHSPNVRKILQSAKTFANHLDDFQHTMEHNPHAAFFPLPPPLSGAAATAHSKNKRRPPPKKKDTDSKGRRKEHEKHASESEPHQKHTPATDDDAPPPVPKIPLLASLPADLIPTPHPSDTDPLLTSRIPPPPTAEEIKALVTARPLTYMEARAEWPDTAQGKLGERAVESSRRRHFCEVCGYWGKIKCTRCGSRVCALDCLETHREECITRYGI